MKYLILIPLILLFLHRITACDFVDKNIFDNANTLMAKKSQFYAVYKQGKCVLEAVLSSLPKEQR